MNRRNDIGTLDRLTPESLAEMEAVVRQRLCGQLRDFRLSIRDSGLALGGRTLSFHAKQLAQHALMDITRAPITANEIEVRPPRLEPSGTGVAVDASLIGRMPSGSPPGGLTM
jgi:hypothetical protein